MSTARHSPKWRDTLRRSLRDDAVRASSVERQGHAPGRISPTTSSTPASAGRPGPPFYSLLLSPFPSNLPLPLLPRCPRPAASLGTEEIGQNGNGRGARSHARAVRGRSSSESDKSEEEEEEERGSRSSWNDVSTPLRTGEQ
jgi:hypothetical protein